VVTSLSLWSRLLSLLVLSSLSLFARDGDPRHVGIFRSWVDARERETGGYNRSPLIDRANKNARIPLRSPYCGSTWGLALDLAGASFPKYRGGHALSYLKEEKISTEDVLAGRASLQRGDLGAFRNGKTWKGHLCGVDSVIDRRTIRTLEANTSSGAGGSQRDGDGFFYRIRTLSLYSYFRLVGFVRPRYPTVTTLPTRGASYDKPDRPSYRYRSRALDYRRSRDRSPLALCSPVPFRSLIA
jgi:hypothetical protein